MAFVQKYIVSLLICGSIISVVSIYQGYAQESGNKVLRSVRVEGNNTIDADLIKLLSELVPVPKDVFGEDFSKAVKLLWDLESFSDIQIYADNPVDDTLDVVVKVKEYPSINSVQFVGNNKIDDNKFINELNLYSGSKLSPGKILAGTQKIKSLYYEKGYLLAEVDPQQVSTEEDHKVDLVYTITEGERVKIKNITFEGNKNYSDKTLRKQFEKTKQDGWLRGGDFNKDNYEADKKKLIEYFNKEGYRDAVILSDSISFSQDKRNMDINIKVDEGIRY